MVNGEAVGATEASAAATGVAPESSVAATAHARTGPIRLVVMGSPFVARGRHGALKIPFRRRATRRSMPRRTLLAAPLLAAALGPWGFVRADTVRILDSSDQAAGARVEMIRRAEHEI